MTFPAPLTGVVPPVCTPLTPDREVDVPSLLRLVEHLVEGGVHGLFLLGSTSEAAFLTDRQRREVVEAVVGHIGRQLPVLAGAIDMTTPRVLDHVRAVTAAGAQAVVVTAPFYARTHPSEIVHHFRRIAAASPVPVIAYDIPSAVHSKLPTEVVLGLAADGVLAGLKDSSGDLAAFREVVTGARAHAGFSALTGSELLVDSALALGADGVVPGLGNVDPHGYVRLYRAARAGDWQSARDEQDRLCALFGMVGVGDPARMGGSSSAIGAFKAALHLRGIIDCPVTAEPQVPLSGGEVEKVGKFLAGAGLL
ncbi:4-hydroxy-tetrahydrodipicolinate synthase [Streptomyces griseochromogenes]|uniref:4-hydroxy-tetrahydrodipicolinate synthase n=1 Tax=Streptomyces griseochromogenes TaxID=68214 RepID=A0A1B1B7Z9_9ACTN|nr:dihydrodipicolinate synthase family protein [Streptomyces griseochromogenes]ANP54919.1 dihydrodipicolinate synthase family protein [Streptomyces griseochromogenes]MBP2050707.1 4-hydroxy-tetrahydrodipicolinate synthase [Streptomyces griseochromogenes]